MAASVIGKGPHQVARLLDDSALLPHKPVTALLDNKREKRIRAGASDCSAKPVDIDQSLMRVWLR